MKSVLSVQSQHVAHAVSRPVAQGGVRVALRPFVDRATLSQSHYN